MPNYVNLEMSGRSISVGEGNVPFPVVMDDFAAGASVTIQVRRFMYDPHLNEQKAINSGTASSGVPVEITMYENHRQETGASVVIVGNTQASMNGTFMITSAGPKSFTLDGPGPSPPTPILGTGGIATFISAGSTDISANAEIIDIGLYRAVDIKSLFLDWETPMEEVYRVQVIMTEQDGVRRQEANIIIGVTT